MTKKRIHLLYGILLSAMLVIAGICLCVACVGIYLSGEQPFSREAVAAAFGYIAVPVYLCAALAVGGFLLNGFAPLETKRSPDRQYRLLLAHQQQKLDLEQCSDTLKNAIIQQQKKRRLHNGIALGLLAAGCLIFLSYACNPANFHQSEINRSMLQAMGLFVPCLGVPFLYAVFAGYVRNRSYQEEIGLIKQALAEGARNTAQATPKNNGHGLLYLRLALLCIGVGIMIFGFLAGGTADVLTKAVNICTECVGLG